MLQKEQIDFVIPIYNEAACISELMRRLLETRKKMHSVDVSIIFVNDGSRDDSLTNLLSCVEEYPFVRLVNLSRNFGHQAAVTAGLDFATGDYVCIIDADLQDPPELVEQMYLLAKKSGLNVVYGQRRQRHGETAFKKVTARLFYWLLCWMCQIEIPRNTGDFRLIDRKVVNSLRQMRETHRFLRGMVPWAGFKSASFMYDREPRHAGETKYPLRKMFKFALDAIFSFSNKPLRIASYIGFAVVSVGCIGLFYMLYLKFFSTRVVPGLMVMLSSMAIIGGFQIVMLGMLGEYLGRVFEQVKNRPVYFVDSLWNMDRTSTGDGRFSVERAMQHSPRETVSFAGS